MATNGVRKLRCISLVIALIALASLASDAYCQGQANSPEEFDAYLDVLAPRAPLGTIAAAQAFEHHWIRSELLPQVYVLEIEAYRRLDQAAQAIRVGEKALEASPENVALLSLVAYLIANSTVNPSDLDHAADCARRAITNAAKLPRPEAIDSAEWIRMVRSHMLLAHSALGLVEYKHGDSAGALRAFLAATQFEVTPDPALHYRLAILFEAGGDCIRAKDEYSRVIASENDALRSVAKDRAGRMKPCS